MSGTHPSSLLPFMQTLNLIDKNHPPIKFGDFDCLKNSSTTKLLNRSAMFLSVNNLLPQDFGSVSAIGDSTSAGLFAGGNSLLLGLIEVSNWRESRDLSFVAGANPGAWTLFNFFHRYNSHLKGGAAVGHMLHVTNSFLAGPSSWVSQYDGLNAAWTGAGAEHASIRQAPFLIRRMEEMLGRDEMMSTASGHWKFVNIFIGFNDLCEDCGKTGDGSTLHSTAERYKRHVNSTIAYLRRHLRGVYVNLVPLSHNTMDASFEQVVLERPYCRSRRVSNMLRATQMCPCLRRERVVIDENEDSSERGGSSGAGGEKTSGASTLWSYLYFFGKEDKFTWDNAITVYNDALQSVAEWWRDHCGDASLVEGGGENGGGDQGCDDFGIHFRRGLAMNFEDENGQEFFPAEFISSSDCYHPSAKGQAGLAQTIWRGMFDARDASSRPLAGNVFGVFCPEVNTDRLLLWPSGEDEDSA